MTSLDPQFLRAVVLMTGFKPDKMRRVQAALLMLGLQGLDYTAADIPDELTEGSQHIAGAATGSLVAIGLLSVIGRIKSPDAKAKGRKLDLLRLLDVARARGWLKANGFEIPKVDEQEVIL